VFTWRHQILKSKTKEPLKVLSSSGVKDTKFISAYNLLAHVASFVWKPAHFEFRIYGGAWHEAKIAFVEKYTFISWYLAILGVEVLGKVPVQMSPGSAQTTSRPDSQSKFQMFTLFSGRHIGGLRRSSNMAAPYLRGTFRRISQLWESAHTLNLTNCLLYLSSIISQFLDFIH